MNLEEDAKGNYEVKGVRYKEMPMKIVDTGYGLERIVWITHGSNTVYDAIFPYTIDMIRENAREDMHAIYAIADHARCLAFMLGDGIVPSNSGAGYLARLIIRRALRFMKKIGYKEGLFPIVNAHIEHLSPDFPELKDEKARIEEILEIEEEKFQNVLRKGRAMVMRALEKSGRLDDVCLKFRGVFIFIIQRLGFVPICFFLLLLLFLRPEMALRHHGFKVFRYIHLLNPPL